MMKILASLAAGTAALCLSVPASAASVLLGLGDSITFGETDLRYIPSLGDRGYVDNFANTLAAQNGGVRPDVVNLAIDGETADSFMDGTGRTPPVVGRTDLPLVLQNLNYDRDNPETQEQLFARTVQERNAAGDSIEWVTITLGFNELAALAGQVANGALTTDQAIAQIDPTLATYRANYTNVLSDIRAALPDANLYLLNYFNPFPADPGNPAGPIFAAGGPQLNAIIFDLAREFDAFYVDTFTPFVGNEAEYTFIDEVGAGDITPPPYSPSDMGLAPIGNVHPNETPGYDVIARQVASAQLAAAIPEPASWALMILGFGAAGAAVRRRKVAVAYG